MVSVLVVYEGESTRKGVYELSELGIFEETGFRGIIKGEVESLEHFLKCLEEKIKTSFLPVSRVVPIEEWFYFSPENFLDIVKKRIKKYLEQIGSNETFCIRVERRGMKGIFSSKDLEREIGSYVYSLLKERDGVEHKVDLKDPDKMIIVETIGNLAGMAVISKENRKLFPLIRVK
ncbi:MAG: THUMP domain-containing protein [Nitrososphaeria archaeon]|nr:THUMP domain-containing protein [Nitrososphaeria archaeon]